VILTMFLNTKFPPARLDVLRHHHPQETNFRGWDDSIGLAVPFVFKYGSASIYMTGKRTYLWSPSRWVHSLRGHGSSENKYEKTSSQGHLTRRVSVEKAAGEGIRSLGIV
jgi:hypothetical protein